MCCCDIGQTSCVGRKKKGGVKFLAPRNKTCQFRTLIDLKPLVQPETHVRTTSPLLASVVAGARLVPDPHKGEVIKIEIFTT